ncbi:MAG: heme A synthase [Acidimicrobiia bacterium]|nr:heme A synthase [Acidimicrobiia bacterium]
MTKQRLSIAWWGALVLTEFVILWGAVVRATGSGAGCGANWPSCNGEIIPLGSSTETLIEFTHRVTSGIALMAIVLLWWLGRNVLEGLAARGARWSVVFIVIEAIIGAGLVLFEWTGTDASVARAVAIAVHLSNTLLLLGALTITASNANRSDESATRLQPPALVKVGLVAVLVVAAAGAVTALGDTLFPAESLSDGLRQDLSASSSFLVNLRVIHPVLAVGVAGFVIWVTQRFRDGAPRLATSVIVVVGLQVLAGFVNVALLAPVWMQVVHLLLADVLWIAMVLFALALSRSTAKSAVSVNA